jgi:hypothetical protein
VSCIEGLVRKHFTELLSTWHASVQCFPPPPIFHIMIPSVVHCASLDMAILSVNPLSPGGKTSLSEAYLPAAHLLQAEAPESEYWPAAHLAQAEAPAAEYVPAAQLAQVEASVAPSAAENLPAAQSEHLSLAAAAENLPLAHGRQSVAASLPSDARYVPTAQLVHVDAPR